jgi:hypothetical protein
VIFSSKYSFPFRTYYRNLANSNILISYANDDSEDYFHSKSNNPRVVLFENESDQSINRDKTVKRSPFIKDRLGFKKAGINDSKIEPMRSVNSTPGPKIRPTSELFFTNPFEEKPTDSVTTVNIKSILYSLSSFIVIFLSIFTTSLYVFPGSFRHINSISMTHNNIISYDLSYPEYSESGGVMFHDNDIPLPKTKVTVLPFATADKFEDENYSVEDL